MNNLKKLKLTWLCQGNFLLEGDGIRIVVDPYLSDALADRGMPRMQPVPVSFEDLKPDVVIFTHDHLDHFDEESVRPIAKMYPNCVFVGPSSTYEHFKKMGYDPKRFVIMDVGDAYARGGVLVKAVKAHHSDPKSIGLVISISGRTVYISGDTLFEDDLAEGVKKACGKNPLDIVAICINGKLGNMKWDEAVKVVEELAPGMAAIPMHYGLFAKNTEDPEPFVNALRGKSINAHTMVPGKAELY